MTRKQRTSILDYATPEELSIINEIKQKCKERRDKEELQKKQYDKLSLKIQVLRSKIKQMQEEEQNLLVRQYEINYGADKND